MSEQWAEIADTGPEWPAVEAGARAEVLASVLGSDVNRLTDLFVAVCEANRRYRDFTRHELHHALREVIARLPVYRTYVTPRGVSERDRRLISETVSEAAAGRPDLDPELFEFLGALLRLEVDGPLAVELAMRFQQLTPAAMAKGVEDTAFYRHHRLVALNEVGGDPGRFGVSPADFHRSMAAARREWPGAMLSLSTHDTKRSADIRARLALLSQDPDGWRAVCAELSTAARRYRASPDAPTDADAYLFFQTAVGAWPIDADRAVTYMHKATREAKLRTSWTAPDEEYDRAVEAFVRGTLSDASFLARLDAFVGQLADAWQRAALAQLALQLTAPGVPDIYQGNELWDLSLVDPDNRRPVDFDHRRALLGEVQSMPADEAWARRDAGVAKLWLLARLLVGRGRSAGEPYRALVVRGPLSDAAVAFEHARRIAVAPRLALRVERDGWRDTSIELPAGSWRNIDGCEHAGRVRLGELLASFPVAVMDSSS